MPERGSKTSTVPVVWATFGFFRRNPNDFLSRLVTMDETWLYHYYPETKQQSMEWRHSGSPRPQKIPSVKIRWKSFRLDFLGSRRYPPHWLSSKGPNYQRVVLLISAGAIEGYFEGKPQKKLAYLGFQCFDHPPYSPDLAPSDYKWHHDNVVRLRDTGGVSVSLVSPWLWRSVTKQSDWAK